MNGQCRQACEEGNLRNEYHELTQKDGAPFVPYAVWKDLFFAAFIVLAVATCAAYFGPFGPTGQPDPTIIQRHQDPITSFVALRSAFFLPPSMETPALLIGPVIVIGALLLLPFRPAEERKVGVGARLLFSRSCLSPLQLATFTHLAGYTPWSPHMNAWSSDPIPARFLQHRLHSRGKALVFQAKQCHNCHALRGREVSGSGAGQRCCFNLRRTS